MKGMTGSELIKETKNFLLSYNAPSQSMPKFAFKATKFWEMPANTIDEIFSLGVKSQDVIEQLTPNNL
jgi:hypothetical protein